MNTFLVLLFFNHLPLENRNGITQNNIHSNLRISGKQNKLLHVFITWGVFFFFFKPDNKYLYFYIVAIKYLFRKNWCIYFLSSFFLNIYVILKCAFFVVVLFIKCLHISISLKINQVIKLSTKMIRVGCKLESKIVVEGGGVG